MNPVEYVILVDQQDREIGLEEKLAAHQKALCHRAFSVFIFRQNESLQWELLLQQRQEGKYHSGGLWTNTCCSHPRVNEPIVEAGQRRLFEEMGIHCKLQSVGHFHYIAHLDQGLTENELDHVLVGFYPHNEIPFNQAEVKSFRWIELSTLENELKQSPEHFTQWFEQAYQLAKNSLSNI